MQGRDPVTGKMPVPQVLLLKGQHYITGRFSPNLLMSYSIFNREMGKVGETF